MGTYDACTRLLGLALRGGNLVTGSDAVQSAAYAGQIRLLMISADASPHVCRDAQMWAERGNCTLIALPCDKAELGGALGRGNVAVAALTDTGLAAAVAERLARIDPERYAATAERFRRKVERAGERKAAKARARPANASGAARDVKRKPGAGRDKKSGAANAVKRKTEATNAAAKRKSGAANATVKRKSDAEHDKKPGATRKSDAPTRKPDATRGRSPNRAGNPRPRRKNTDT